MIQSSTERKVMSKRVAVFLVRMCFLCLLMSFALLLAGCATVSHEDRAFFYSGWVNPNSETPVQ
jgi:hypothetical protein